MQGRDADGSGHDVPRLVRHCWRRLQTAGLDSTQPKADNSKTLQGRALNRRVELVYLPLIKQPLLAGRPELVSFSFISVRSFAARKSEEFM